MNIFKFILIFFTILVYAQNGFQIENKSQTTINFKFINNLILLPININGTELTFLLDSGVSETLLFSIENKDINLKNLEKTSFTGLGKDLQIEGLKSANNLVKIGTDYIDKSHTLFIILDESINFSDRVGIPVNGIIGYSFFKNYPVKIDFKSKKITIYEKIEILEKKLKRYEEFPISIELSKPYIVADVELTTEKKPAKLLVDFGNTDSVWLFPSFAKYYIQKHPNITDFLGRGFNGDIFGERSRIHGLYLHDFHFEKPLIAVPNENSIQHLNLVKDRSGSIGSEIWRRFTLITDYPNQKLYLRKNRDFSDLFLFNKSGLDIKHTGMFWEQDLVKITPIKPDFNKGTEVYTNPESKFQYKFILKPQYAVSDCREKSPCDAAGIKKDDQIISIDGKKTSELSLAKITNTLKEGENGKVIRLEIKRGNLILDKKLTLEDPIPYTEENK